MNLTSKRKKKNNKTRISIIEATEKIMLEESHFSVNSRRIAAISGIKSPLIHYYFDTMDDLFLEVYQKVESLYMERLASAATSPEPLRMLWSNSTNFNAYETKMILEFASLSAKNPRVAEELSKSLNKARCIESDITEREMNKLNIPEDLKSPSAISFLITGSAMRILNERSIGITEGHDEVIAFVEKLLDRIYLKDGNP